MAVEQHRRRVSTSVVNEVLQEAVSWRSPSRRSSSVSSSRLAAFRSGGPPGPTRCPEGSTSRTKP